MDENDMLGIDIVDAIESKKILIRHGENCIKDYEIELRRTKKKLSSRRQELKKLEFKLTELIRDTED